MKNGYTIYNSENAPEESRELLQQVQQHYPFVPNALGAMAESPATVAAYMQMSELAQKTSFSPLEQHIIFLTVSREYGCEYCVAAHTCFAQMDQVERETIERLRAGEPLTDSRLQALHGFTQRLVQTGCNPSESEIKAFLEHGFTRRNVLELVLMMSNKLIAIFSNRIMGTDLDEAMAPAKWEQVA